MRKHALLAPSGMPTSPHIQFTSYQGSVKDVSPYHSWHTLHITLEDGYASLFNCPTADLDDLVADLGFGEHSKLVGRPVRAVYQRGFGDPIEIDGRTVVPGGGSEFLIALEFPYTPAD